jgi:hypothetical protein
MCIGMGIDSSELDLGNNMHLVQDSNLNEKVFDLELSR